MQFARVAHATDFLYCYSIIEANKRSDYASTNSPGSRADTRSSRHVLNSIVLGESMQTELNTFFPFDPYKLPRSGLYIDAVYRDWAQVAVDDEDEDEDDEDDGGEIADEPSSSSYHGHFSGISSGSSPQDTEAEKLGVSFGGMSISPAHAPISMSFNSVMSVS